MVRATQPVGEPGPHGGPPRDLAPGLQEADPRLVVDRRGVHRGHDRDAIRDPGRVGGLKPGIMKLLPAGESILAMGIEPALRLVKSDKRRQPR